MIAVKPGDLVRRFFSPEITAVMRVTEVDEAFIYVGNKGLGWKFRRDNGCEVDEDLHWDGVTKTGSYILPEHPANEETHAHE